MKFFIVTPCRNAGHLLGETISSILGQSLFQKGGAELEYWIQDGASTDPTRSVVEGFADSRIHFDSTPDSGMYEALSRRLRHADGDIVAYLNAGDVYFPTAFEVLLEVFSHPGVDWITGYSCLINEASQLTAAWKPPRFRREFVQNGTYLRGFPILGIQQESTFWSNRANGAIDFDKLARFKLAGDYFIWTELARHHELNSLMSLLGAFRQHEGQLSEQQDAYHAEAASLVRPATRHEDLTAWWEFRANPWVKKPLWNFILPPSPARIFEYSAPQKRWQPR